MNWIHFVWPMATGSCLTIALVYLWTGLRGTSSKTHLLLSLHTLVAAVYSVLEFRLIQAQTPSEYLSRLQLQDLSSAGLLAPIMVIYVWVYFGTGRKWLAILGIVMMEVAMTLNLGSVPKLVFLEVTSVRQVPTFGGATYAVAEGVRNPWNALCYLAVLLMLSFVVDASVGAWRRCGHRSVGWCANARVPAHSRFYHHNAGRVTD